jgi:hypothetical protein
LLSVLALCLFAAQAPAQQVPLRDLPKPVKEIDDPFSMVSAATEFKPGQLVIVDGVEGKLSIADFAKGTHSPLGRTGSGPGEYRVPGGAFRLPGDTLWVLDAGQMRFVVFNPDLSPGTTFPFMMFDQTTSSALTPFAIDDRRRVYAYSMAIQVGRGGGRAAVQIPDSVGLVRVDPRGDAPRTEITRVRFPTSGKPEMTFSADGRSMLYKMAYPGLVAADAYAVFPDGRVAVVRGSNYSVTFFDAAGTPSAPIAVPYERFRVTDADKKAEFDEFKRLVDEQKGAIQRNIPAGMTMSIEVMQPAEWTPEFPPLSPLPYGVHAAPDGRLWLRRATPTRLNAEQWDVLDRAGTLVARWKLPPKTSIVAVGAHNVVYAVRTDEDDLRYIQRIEIPR